MISTVEELRARLAEARSSFAEAEVERAPRVALISTIGALHDGHVDLVHTARELADITVVSIFVNPLRFATREEYEDYPRTPEADELLLESLGVDIVFAPAEAELLPHGAATTRVSAGELGRRYEGRARPSYFDGLLTVEAQLLDLVRPDVAVYGQRDRQRIFLVRRMAEDLFLDVDIVEVPTVRGDDGLPISTRAGLLEDRDLAAAARLTAALEAAASTGDGGVDACIAAAQSTLMGEPRIRLEYLSVVDPATFLPVTQGYRGPAIVLIAASVAGQRFIDNADIHLG